MNQNNTVPLTFDYERMREEMIERELEWHLNNKTVPINHEFKSGFIAGMKHIQTLEETLMDTLNEAELSELGADEGVALALRNALTLARKNKPNDRSEKDRLYAITITDLHKIVSFFDTAVMRNDDGGVE